MKDREKILRYFAASGEEAGEIAERLLDLAEAADGGRPFTVSPFFSPFAVQIGMTIAAHTQTLSCQSNGGFHEAERVRIAFVRQDYDGPVDFGITALKVTWDARYRLLGHRDVLGSLMGLGIERDVFGDILMDGASAEILVDTKMVPWISENFKKIAMVPVTAVEMDLADVTPPKQEAKIVRATVASLRLDAVGAAGFGISRSKMASAIDGERVQVNWQTAKGPSQAVKVGDIISYRGRGRVEIKELTGQSRKGRLGVLMDRYR